MPLSWNEIKSRALAFSREWQQESSEDAEAKSFWDGFFNVFGISRRRVATFEEPVKKLDEKYGYVDLFWKGVLVVEHKSRGKSLDKAYDQALDYFQGLKERDLPKYVIVSDFARIRLYDLEENEQHEFELKDLHKNVRLFGFIAGYQTHKIQAQDPVNIRAAEQMGKLHDRMKDSGYTGHPLEVYLVRLLFCLFAEDTGIFEKQQFKEYLEERTGEDGADLAYHLSTLFQVLNTPREKRLKNLDEQLAAFPYVNGKLFEELLPTAGFDSPMRQELLDCCSLDWSRISPAIFGSLFQSIMDKQARRNLGAHYTSEENILKLIKPLFLDALWEEFEKIKHNKNRLFEFHKRLRRLNFFDPACGCGNFLVIAYRELRLLELEILRASRASDQSFLDVHSLLHLNVDQFYGIEIEEFPAQIAQVALWLMDHQMNLLVSEEFGQYFVRIPLQVSSTIVCGNALRIDWKTVIPPWQVSYIMGNPPFVGKHLRNKDQNEDMELVCVPLQNFGTLDYVCAWYIKAVQFIKETEIRVAFVSTNSITQGEQIGVLWQWLLDCGVKIHFSHRTFRWSNDARGNAAVFCVIIGFGLKDTNMKRLYDYADPDAEPHQIVAHNISPYLVDAQNVLIPSRSKPICQVPSMFKGSQPTDNGNFLFTDSDKEDFLKHEPNAKKFILPLISAHQFLNGENRWCLWLEDASPSELRAMPMVAERINKVRSFRLQSKKVATVKLAEVPSLFAEIRQPKNDFVLIPRHSSENRHFIPMAFFDKKHIVSDSCASVPNATAYHFGILQSTMHMSWTRQICGRIKGDYRYSNSIVYNNFPWPENPTEKQKQAIETAAQAVLDARAQFPGSSLADLYDPLTMPPVLLKAHQSLDRAVDAAYGKTNFKTEAERVAFLFELYQKYTSLFPPEKPKRRRS